MERSTKGMRAPSPPHVVERSSIVTPPHQTQAFVGQFQLTMGGESAMQPKPTISSVLFMGPSTMSIQSWRLEARNAKEVLGRWTPTIQRWFNMMEGYFRLIKYPTDIWVDVIATHVMHATQA